MKQNIDQTLTELEKKYKDDKFFIAQIHIFRSDLKIAIFLRKYKLGERLEKEVINIQRKINTHYHYLSEAYGRYQAQKGAEESDNQNFLPHNVQKEELWRTAELVALIAMEANLASTRQDQETALDILLGMQFEDSEYNKSLIVDTYNLLMVENQQLQRTIEHLAKAISMLQENLSIRSVLVKEAGRSRTAKRDTKRSWKSPNELNNSLEEAAKRIAEEQAAHANKDFNTQLGIKILELDPSLELWMPTP